MTQTQPEALRLADRLESVAEDPMWSDHTEISKSLCENSASELRRLHAENWQLRRNWCSCYAGASAYTDDGEAQDNRDLPTIDFLSDSVPEIEDKIQRRGLKQLSERSRPALSDEQIEAAAQKLAERLDYPWEYMADTGREHMRSIATEVMQMADGVGEPT